MSLVGVRTFPNGCRLHRDCFTCPFPDCFAECGHNMANRSLARQQRNIKIKEMLQAGYSTEQVARKFDVSKRTVIRVHSSL